MSTRRTLDLLPEIFRTKTNEKFLSATLDQLTQEPQIKRTQGFVGRRVGPGVDPADNYVIEPTAVRADYQLEPGVVFLKPDTNQARDAITYPGMIDALNLAGSNTVRQDNLWSSEYYAWDPFVDLDKFANYNQYYWLPSGPESVDVGSSVIPLTDDFVVTRSQNAYQFSGILGDNPVLTLVRGGTYRFDVSQPGHRFFIQTNPGVDGRIPATPNISSRDVFGVENNGVDGGTVTFNVPLKTAQDFFYTLDDIGGVDLICPFQFDQLNNVYVDVFLAQNPGGIDGITNLDQRTVIFTNRIDNAEDGGWQVTTQFDPLIRTAPNQISQAQSYDLQTRTVPNQVGASVSYDVNGEPYDILPFNTITDVVLSGSPDPLDGLPGTFDADNFGFNEPIISTVTSGSPDPLDGFPGSYDSIPFDQTTDITSQSQRYSIWRINYVTDTDGRSFMRLSVVQPVPELSKFKIRFGTVNSSTNWYKDASGYFERMPLLTAVEDTLWYQDSTNPEIFGRIRLVDSSTETPLDVSDIVGAKNFTSPNGVRLTNGLRIQFRGPTLPASYQDQEFYVEGVGTGPGIDLRVGFVDGEAYFGEFHVVSGQRITGPPQSGFFQQFIYDDIEQSIINAGQGTPAGASLPVNSQPGATEGNGIRLVPVRELVTPESYTRSATIPYDATPYDATPYDAALNAPLVPDYITINRSSSDRNAWSRSNRWFHVDVIRQSAELNNTVAVIDNLQRAQRPIVEFRADLALWNFGTQGIMPVNIIDFTQTDALSNVNGTIGYGIDGFELINGSTVIFAADTDPQVRNRVYRAEFIRPDGDANTPLQINLVPMGPVALTDQTVVCTSGITLQGVSFWFDGDAWVRAQQKVSVNQAPLFDIFDLAGHSLGDLQRYPSSDFQGTRLFGYALGGTQRTDEVLGFALRFENINNVGDIVFENYLYTDQFRWVQNNIGVEQPISQGFVRQYLDRVSFTSLIGWQPAAAENRSRQVFRFVYDGSDLVFDVPVDLDSVLPPLQIFAQGVFVDPSAYSVSVQGSNTFVTFAVAIEVGTVIEAQVLSRSTSPTAFYQVPLNLENNALNQNSARFTLGTIRSQYESIAQNLKTLQGPVIGSNNSRDLGNILPYGQNIVQHSSPVTLAGTFLRDTEFDIFPALQFNDREYSKFKAALIDLAAKGDFINLTATQILDIVIEEISLAKSENSPFYWSDMLPSGDTYTVTETVVSPITTPEFDLNRTYDFRGSNYQSVLVYVNGRLLTRGYEYVVSDDAPVLTVLIPLVPNDQVQIREYDFTAGSYVPNTPTKLGLYPAYRPEVFLDTTYVNPVPVIRGHDGSITVAYGDIRDQILLEFETRIFNNLKVPEQVPLVAEDVIPGQFRETDYDLGSINQILAQDFLSWVAWNKLDYITQDYQATNEFTFNYSQSANKLNGEPLLGAWRGIYNFFYDTIYPNERPWEMLGFSQEPVWWQDQYGPAPYTSGNLVLWHDLATGIVRDPLGTYVRPLYRRPDLLNVIPAGSEGQLLSPLESVTGRYDDTSFRRSWTFGDDGPTENAWRTSSSWPFAVMRLLALTKPAEFFSLGVDRDRYQFDPGVGQWLWDKRYRLDANSLGPLYGSGVSKASFLDWIIDYNRQSGTDSTSALSETLSNLDIRLCWRAAGFTDKQYLKIYAERSTPTGSNAGLLLPDESYSILLYQNQAFQESLFSSVIVQRTTDGWAVYGYNTSRPFFNILISRAQGRTREIQAGGTSVRVATEYTNSVVRVPYGKVFTNRAAVCDFLLSYGQVLIRQGFQFETVENGLIMNWDQMAQEFLYWSNQGWIAGSVINLNPGATALSVTTPGAVAQSLTPPRTDNLVLNQNRQPIAPAQLVIDRQGNSFNISTASAETINYLNLRLTAYEHLVILDNRSIFADLIYDPATGARQSRVRVTGVISAAWDGTVNAPGFVLSEPVLQDWQPNRRYTKGDIVRFKDKFWVASRIINPQQEFDYSIWIRTDQDEIQRGLLPNAANSSDQLAQAYDVNTANLEQEVDLFSYGLIGFRPRDYMAALDLSDVSQVNLYRQFIGIKGTKPSAEIFSLADLGKETAEYKIYEYWAVQQSVYGANANRSYFEILLDQPKLTSDPSIVQIILPGQTSEADQTVLLQDLWKQSFKIPTPDVLPTLPNTVNDRGLPSAGYVSLDDVDITLFDINQSVQLSQNLDQIGVGTTLWVAKVNPYDWNVYQTQRTSGNVIRVSDNLDGLSLVTFDQAHGLSVGDVVIIRFFAPVIDGAYRVISVPSIYTLLIEFTFVGNQTEITGDGIALSLNSLRFSQPSDISQIDTRALVTSGLRVWVDRDILGRWTVLQKTDVWQNSADLEVPVPGLPQGSDYGSSISQGFFNNTALIGAPGYASQSQPATGAVYSFGIGSSNAIEFNNVITPAASQTQRFGESVDMGLQTWAVVGAPGSAGNIGYATILFREPGSDVIAQTQILIPDDTDGSSDQEFGTAVTMSQDERMIYVGAPESSKVYAYARVDVEDQSVEYTTDGVSATYNWSDFIKLPNYTPPLQTSYPQQLVVALNNVALEFGTDWNSNGTDVILSVLPPQGQRLIIARRSIDQLDRTVYTDIVPDSSSSALGSGARFNIEVLRGSYQVTIAAAGQDYEVGDTFTILGTQIGGATPANDLVITVVAPTGQEYRATVTATLATFNVNTSVGLEIGQQLVKISGEGDFASSPVTILDISDNLITVDTVASVSGFVRFYATPGALTNFTQSGTAPVIDSFFLIPRLATVTDIYSFTIQVNTEIYRPFLDYSYDPVSGILDFDGRSPPLGSTILVSSRTHFQKIATIESDSANDRFGQSVSTTTDGRQFFVGAPEDNTATGRVYVYARGWQRFTVQDAAITQYVTQENLEPVTVVKVNGRVLNNNDLWLDGGFTADTVTRTVDILIPLAVGDSIEIETNSFTLLEQFASNAPFAGAEFGAQVDQCVNDCSLYAAAPKDGRRVPQGGLVELWQNQSRLYGSITSRTANPVLTPGTFLSINGVVIENTGVSVADLAQTINSSVLPNARASVSADLVLTGDGETNTFPVGDIYSSAAQYNTVVFLGLSADTAALLTPGLDYNYDNNAKTLTFTSTPFSGAYIRVVSGRLTIAASNLESATPLNKLQVLPVNINDSSEASRLFEDLDFETYVYQQTILPPVDQDFARFGSAIFISDDTRTLTVGAPNGSMILPTVFDSGGMVFDANSTKFADIRLNSGAVYVYDFLDSYQPSVLNPGQFVFGQQIINDAVESLDQFGRAVDLTTGVLLIGSPAHDPGVVFQASNNSNTPAWRTTRIQKPVVDVSLLNSLYIYDVTTGLVNTYLDYFDPLQGKLLGVVRQNLDYIGAVDPAQYNVGLINNQGQTWSSDRVGQMWWDTNECRFIDPNQDDITYASRRWGQIFPGSQVQVYQWTASPTPPGFYTGPGRAKSINNYSVAAEIDDQGVFQETYYFWVEAKRTVEKNAGKTLSAATVAQYIASPRSSGIAYLAPITSSTVALYNALQFIDTTNTALHVEYDRQFTDAAVHVQYQLIAQDRARDFLNDTLYRKLQDSFCGADLRGGAVPDALLPPSERLGINFRPRQSMFANRFAALENYLTSANTVLLTFPAAESRSSALLNSSEPEPPAGSGAWDARVLDLEELGYQDLQQVPLGYRYLVERDSNNRGLWTIYEVQPGSVPNQPVLGLLRVQNFDTKLYWRFVDWFAPGFDPLTRIVTTVPFVADLDTLSLPLNSVVKVSNSEQDRWELYRLQDTGWIRVALQRGTIQFDATLWNYALGRVGFDSEVFDLQYFDQEPTIETRQIIRAINEEIFVGDLLIERNRLLVLMFEYILSEQPTADWLTKTSLIDVDHVIRDLKPFQLYQQDNQDFVLQYIQEVKPYHTQIREFNLIYQGSDVYQGTLTDFDLPAEWDPAQRLFVSPILDDGDIPVSRTSSVPSTSEIWRRLPYNQWFQNYLLSVLSVDVIEAGENYTVPPEVIVIGESTTPAVMRSRINSAGRVVEIIVVDPGSGYSDTALIELVGGNGTGARAVARMGNPLVRAIDTSIRYDRYQYSSSILPWTAGVSYAQDTLVRYRDQVWRAISAVPSQQQFDNLQWQLVPAADLSGVDRTMGYYVPTASQPGLDLSLLISGVDYPGVQVTAPRFDQNTGFDVGNFDINPFDNIAFGPEGLPTYDPAILDATYESDFLDPFLAVNPVTGAAIPDPRAGAIEVAGGAFVDEYSSHAPEELMPGAIFDTLDLRVFTTPGSDWDGDGHGFPTATLRLDYDAAAPLINFGSILANPVTVSITNLSSGSLLTPGTHYFVDWPNLRVQIVSGAVTGDIISLVSAALGGGNQLLTRSVVGDGIQDSVLLPRPITDIFQAVVFINGEQSVDFVLTGLTDGTTRLTFGSALATTQRATITLLGFGSIVDRSWSAPVTQISISDGTTSLALINSLQGTNPANLVVCRNGRRATAAAGIRYVSDGSTNTFLLPETGGYSQDLVAANDVSVYVDNQALTVGVDFFLDPFDISSLERSVSLVDVPVPGSVILISVRTGAQYFVSGNTLQFRATAGFQPQIGDVISVTTWNDTAEQGILTQVFVGPRVITVPVSEGFDTEPFDPLFIAASVSVAPDYDASPYDLAPFDITAPFDIFTRSPATNAFNGDPGSFDYSAGVQIAVNTFIIDSVTARSDRLLVTLDGQFLAAGVGYVLAGNEITIPGPVISDASVVVVTSFTDSTVPGEIAFRVFQDMRGQQTMYRILESQTTRLVSPVSAQTDVLVVEDASRLPEPDLPQGLFGLITIDGERIAYRVRNTVTNEISGLLRGTAGTAASAHLAGSAIYDITPANALPLRYQNRFDRAVFMANGADTTFVAADLALDDLDSSELGEALQVLVAGQLLQLGVDYNLASIDPMTVTLDLAPAAGLEVELRILRALSIYQPGVNTASDGRPLQETMTNAARFIRGTGGG